MAYVTGIYANLVPRFYSGFQITALTRVCPVTDDSLEYLVNFDDGKTWVIYVFPDSGTFSTDFELDIVDSSFIEASSLFSGTIQIAKLPVTSVVEIYDSYSELEIYDTFAGSYPTSVELTGSVEGSLGFYSFNYAVFGPRGVPALIFLLPHHVASITKGQVTFLRLASAVHGMMTAFVGNRFTFTETDLPVDVGFLPYSPINPFPSYTDTQLQTIAEAAASDAIKNVVSESNNVNFYFSAKVLEKYALVCIVVNDILQDRELTGQLLASLKAAFARFAQNRIASPLVYDTTWGGISSSAGLDDGTQEDFGNAQYNDHHFHYGYVAFTAAVIGYLDPEWIPDNKEYVNNLIRDVANPSEKDIYFPPFRTFDWFCGHSWAAGIKPRKEGKDQESSSEDYNFFFGMKLWARVIGDDVLEARANLMLAIQKRSLNSYMLMGPTNNVQPYSFVLNYVSGILFESKVNHTTWFSELEQAILSIHVLPTTAISAYMQSAEFVRDEWGDLVAPILSFFFDGWKEVLYLDYAIAEPATAYEFFANKPSGVPLLESGMSLTWSLAFAAAFS